MANIAPPPGAEPPAGMAGPQDQGGPSLMDAMQQQHDGTAAAFEKLSQGQQLLGKARGMMDKLVAMGDNVTADDAIDMGGQLVGAGLSATAVAQLFASMPPGGDALAAWVKEQEQGLAQREEQMKGAMAATQHHMGVNAFRMLASQHHEGEE